MSNRRKPEPEEVAREIDDALLDAVRPYLASGISPILVLVALVTLAARIVHTAPPSIRAPLAKRLPIVLEDSIAMLGKLDADARTRAPSIVAAALADARRAVDDVREDPHDEDPEVFGPKP